MASQLEFGKSKLQTAPRLYVVTPDLPAAQVLKPLAAVVNAVDVIVQLRCKSLPDAEFIELAHQVTDLCHRAGRLCIINDRLDIAVEAGADGVHLGQTDMSVSNARERFDGIIGSTCRTAEQARTATAAGADYLGVGPTFVSSTKSGLPDAMGISAIAAIADSVNVPVYAIGGMTSDTAAAVTQAGIYGVAVVAAIFDRPDLAAAQAHQLAHKLLSGRNQTGTR